jgi:hypothetical protein
MSSHADTHAPTAPQPKFDNDPPGGPQHNIALTATATGNNTITITGDGAKSLPVGQAATHFKFTLTDNSGGAVYFTSLDAADNSTTCPPPPGNNSSQIVGVTMNNNSPQKTAQFTNNNSNQGQMYISYQWNFGCAPNLHVLPFDPIISNGGKSGPI